MLAYHMEGRGFLGHGHGPGGAADPPLIQSTGVRTRLGWTPGYTTKIPLLSNPWANEARIGFF